MAAGGYQAPASPAPVSNPGAGSARTDGGPSDRQPLRHLPDAQYGEDKAFVDAQRQAPLPQTPQPRPQAQPQQALPDPSSLTPIGAPSQRPDEPVTHGADAGPGANAASLGLLPPATQAAVTGQQFIQQMADQTNNPAVQYLAANARKGF